MIVADGASSRRSARVPGLRRHVLPAVLLLAAQVSASTTACATAPAPIAVRGVVANAAPVRDVVRAGAPTVRVEFGIETDPREMAPVVDEYAAAGARVLLLAGFHARLPVEESARRLGSWAARFGPGSGRALPAVGIEFGNETGHTSQYGDTPDDESYRQRARRYAQLAVIGGRAVRAADGQLPFLVQADSNTEDAVWIDEMFAAEPRLGETASGWTLHPYGPSFAQRLERVRRQTDAHGAPRPLWITEWGTAFDRGRCLARSHGSAVCRSNEDAASELNRLVATAASYDVEALFLYQAFDQRLSGADDEPEHYFGVLTADGGQKGVYTRAAREFWSSGR